MHVVIAPDAFKGTITAVDAATALKAGWDAQSPNDDVRCKPLADGGAGTLQVLFDAANSQADEASKQTDGAEPPKRPYFEDAEVTGPGGDPVPCRWLVLPDGTAAVEVNQTSGLPLLSRPDPLGAHTIGLGQLICYALDAGARSIMVGLGGSASTDGGTGALAALGARFLDAAGDLLPPGGGSLRDLASVDVSKLRKLPDGGVTCLVDVTAPLLGPRGAAAVYGPQKGADGGQTAQLAAGLARLAEKLGGQPKAPGAGSAGGTAYGLAACWGAVITPGAPYLSQRAGLESELADADLVITGEGCYDATSLTGKVTGAVIAAARAAGVPAVLVCGEVSAPVPVATVTLASLAGGTERAMTDPARWLRRAGQVLARTHMRLP